jgi:hypothetical protein
VHLICQSGKTVPQFEQDQITFAIATSKLSDDVRLDSSFGDDFDFLEFRLVDAKKLCHFDHLIGTDKVRRIGEELFDARSKFAAPHRLGKIHADAARSVRIMQTEFADSHLRSCLGASIPPGPVPAVLNDPPGQRRAIEADFFNGPRKSHEL